MIARPCAPTGCESLLKKGRSRTENNTNNTGEARKPAYIAHDITPWPGQASEPEPVGVAFSHRDGNGLDVLLDGVPLSGKLMLRKAGAATTGVTSLGNGIPAKRVDYLAYMVRDGKTREQKGFWRQIGFGYRHGDGEGIDVLYKVVSANSRIVLRVNKEQ